MKREILNEDDFLLSYIDKHEIEKAPEGFTNRVMETIILHPASSVSQGNAFLRYRVPVISVIVTACLIAATIIFGSNNQQAFDMPSFINEIIKAIPEINIGNRPQINFPGWLPWMLVAILMLFIFDKALDSVFHRERKSKH